MLVTTKTKFWQLGYKRNPLTKLNTFCLVKCSLPPKYNINKTLQAKNSSKSALAVVAISFVNTVYTKVLQVTLHMTFYCVYFGGRPNEK